MPPIRLFGGRCAKCGTCLIYSDGDRRGRCAECVRDEQRAREQGAIDTRLDRVEVR